MNGCFLLTDMLHWWKEIYLVILLYLLSRVYGTILSASACRTENSTGASIPLTCKSNQMIHVISVLYGERTSKDDCSVMTTDSYNQLQSNDSNALIVTCNGQATCHEHSACHPCNASSPAFEVTYECVEDSKDICSVLNQHGPLPSMFLHSPGFQHSTGEEGQSCECTVSGSDLDVLMIQHRGSHGGLEITAIGVDNRTWTSTDIVFNRDVASDARSINVSYINHPNRTFWIMVSGNITQISCSNSTRSTESTKTTVELSYSVSSSEMIQSSATNHTEMTTKSISSTDTESSTGSSTSLHFTEKDTENSTGSSNSHTKDDGGHSEEVSLTTTDGVPNPPSTGATVMEQKGDAKGNIILISGAVSGGVILLVVLIIITVCVCRKRNDNTRTMKDEGDIQFTPEYNEYSLGPVSNQPEAVSNMSTTKPNCIGSISSDAYQDVNNQKTNTQMNMFQENGMVDNELYHSKTTHYSQNEKQETDRDEEIEMVDNDLYHSYPSRSRTDINPQSCLHTNTKSNDVSQDRDGSEEDNAAAAAAAAAYDDDGLDNDDNEEKENEVNPNPTFESDVTGDCVNADDVDSETVMVINDLYHSYRKPEIMTIPKNSE